MEITPTMIRKTGIVKQPTVRDVAAMLIAFYSLIQLVNWPLGAWFGTSLQTLLGWALKSVVIKLFELLPSLRTQRCSTPAFVALPFRKQVFSVQL